VADTFSTEFEQHGSQPELLDGGARGCTCVSQLLHRRADEDAEPLVWRSDRGHAASRRSVPAVLLQHLQAAHTQVVDFQLTDPQPAHHCLADAQPPDRYRTDRQGSNCASSGGRSNERGERN
jgi:hypothetical protein